ncbi:MAG: AAA family ATPase [Candidatus Thermoplasmatota archaeon]|nr:AAA family ATPase [Candidatus Thermoplasmatota archaeon]
MDEEELSITPNKERERCVTGIDGLDTILNGGIPRGNSVLITGSCGTGKTTLSLEYLVHGALEEENCLFISVTEASDKMLNNVVPYDFFDESLIEEGYLSFVDMPEIYEELGLLEKSEFSFKEINELIEKIENIVVERDIKRLVIDSVTSVCFQLKSEEKIRDFMLRLMKTLSSHDCTSLLVSEISPEEPRYSQYGVEEAIADGIIMMGNLERHGDLLRTLQVVKMRGTDHSRAKYVLDLTSVGVLLVPMLKGGSAEPETGGGKA